MNAADSRSTLGSIFGAIKTLMGTTVGALHTVDKTIGMADTMVSDAAERQQIRSAIDMRSYRDTYHEQAALRRAEGKKAVSEFVAKSPEHAMLYTNAYNDLAEALREKMQARQAAERASKANGVEATA